MRLARFVFASDTSGGIMTLFLVLLYLHQTVTISSPHSHFPGSNGLTCVQSGSSDNLPCLHSLSSDHPNRRLPR